MKEYPQCDDDDKIKPLDRMFDDQIIEFESGEDKTCDRDLDKMIWELGDYGNEEPPIEATEFDEDKPVEEELIERKMIHGSNKKPYYLKNTSEDINEEDVVIARSIGPERRRKSSTARTIAPLRKKKKNS